MDSLDELDWLPKLAGPAGDRMGEFREVVYSCVTGETLWARGGRAGHEGDVAIVEGTLIRLTPGRIRPCSATRPQRSGTRGPVFTNSVVAVPVSCRMRL